LKKLLLFLVSLTLVGTLSAVACAPSGGAGDDGDGAVAVEYEWRCADFYTEGSDAGLTVERFCDILNGLSGGRINVDYYGSGVLGSYEETFDACSRGELEFCMISPYSSYHELLNLKGMPFAGTTFDKADQIFMGDGIVRQMVNDAWNELGLEHMLTIDGGFYCYCQKDAPIVSPADMAGKKYRVPPADVYVEVFERAAPDAVGQVLPWAEYYSALERGVVDGGPAFMNSYEPMKFVEVAPYYTDVNQNYNFDDVLMNKELYDSLPTDIQGIIDEAARVAEHYGRSSCRAGYAASEQRCIDGGATFTHLTDEQRQVFIDAVKPTELWEDLYKDLLEKYYPGENMFDKMVAEIARVEGW